MTLRSDELADPNAAGDTNAGPPVRIPITVKHGIPRRMNPTICFWTPEPARSRMPTTRITRSCTTPQMT